MAGEDLSRRVSGCSCVCSSYWYHVQGRYNASRLSKPLYLCWVPTGTQDITRRSHLFARKQPSRREVLQNPLVRSYGVDLGKMTNGDCHTLLFQDFSSSTAVPIIQQLEVRYLHKNRVCNASWCSPRARAAPHSTPRRPKPAPPGAAALQEAWQSLSKHPSRQLTFSLLRDVQEPKPSTRLCHRRDSKGYVC